MFFRDRHGGRLGDKGSQQKGSELVVKNDDCDTTGCHDITGVREGGGGD